MANRYPNRGHQPHRGGMGNRGMPNRNMYNEGFIHNQNMTNRGGSTGLRLNANDSFQPNTGMSSSGRPSFGLHSNQSFQGNQNIQNRSMPNPGMNRNQGYQPNQNLQNRDMPESEFNYTQGYTTDRQIPNTDNSNFNCDINLNQGFQTDKSFQNRDISNSVMKTHQGFQNFPNRCESNSGMRTEQGFQSGQIPPNRGVSHSGLKTDKGFQGDQIFQTRDLSNSGMSTNQGFQQYQDMSNRGLGTSHGFQTNQGLPNRGMSNSVMNTHQDIQTNLGLPNRDLPKFGMNRSQGFQTNRDFPNRGISNTDMSPNQGYYQSQEMSNKVLPNPEINVNQGFQSNQSFSGGPYQGINRSQGYQNNQDMPDRGMSNPEINSSQGFQTNPNIPSGKMPGPDINNLSMFNQQNYSQDTSGKSHLSNENTPGSALQGSDRFHMYQPPMFDRNSLEQMGSVGRQQGTIPHNNMPQTSIVQHVMIPVPVPVGTDIPPHLLRPQIITSSNQNQFPGPQIPEMQNQGQVANIQGQFPVIQGQYQGQNQMTNVLGQRNMPANSIQGQFHAPDTSIQANNSRVNDLSYYMGNESRNVISDQSTDRFPKSFDHDKKDKYQQGTDEEMYVNRDQHVENFRHFEHDKFQRRLDESERERVRSDRSRSQYSSYTPDYFERSGQDVPRTSSGSQMYDKEFDHYRKHDDYVMINKDVSNTGQSKYTEKDEAFVSQNRFGREHTPKQEIDFTREKEYERGKFERYDSLGDASLSDKYRDNKNAQHSNDYRDKPRQESERRSGAVLYTDGSLESTRTSDFTNEFQRHADLHVYSDRDNDVPRERQMNETKQSSKAILYKDENSEVLEGRGIEQYGRDKRKPSPVPVEISSKKLKRTYSPVSDNKSHGELKIHVSDRGRWIEGNTDLSPVSDCVDEVERYNTERKKDDLDNVSQKEADYDQASLDGAEMVSDSESYIDDMRQDELKIYARDQSPVSQHSPRRIIEKKSENVIYTDAERVSPSRSNYSRFSDERSQSHRSRHSDDKRKSSEMSEASGYFTEQKSQHSDRKIENLKLNVPNLCRAHNQKGCYWDGCAGLHVCKFYIIDQCKFGEHCSKGHDLLRSQPYGVLSKGNPGIRISNATAEEFKRVLKERITSNTPASQNKRSNSNFVSKEISPIRDAANEVVAADPSFDARNYVTGMVVDARDKLDKKKSNLNTDKSKNDQSQTSFDKTKKEQRGTASKIEKSEKKMIKNKDSIYKLNDKKDRGKDDKKIKEKTVKQTQTNQTKNENMLSPVSGDEDDWEKYEKYEQVSDNDMSEKEDALDNVSSDESIIEQVQVNRSVESFPLPTAENIAVPIGMNDPLVFNRPLKNNPQSYIGPMNRPPPMFPIANESNAPLFPVIAGQNQPGFGGIPVPGHVPNYLPSPSFMKEVIKNLPPFTVEPPGKKVFNDDNNPRSEVDSPKRKIKSDKVEKEPELKQTIKTLWKFPHKGIINMSIIEFVTETEAYKEEFIAEIVKILVTLELPYVTMKKLLSVIKEKVSINVKSETDMRKILEMYPNNFKMMEMVDSDDESDDSGAKKNIQIKANIGVGFCEKHGFLPFALGKCECNALHLCKFYFLSDCPVKLCKFGHKLKTDHNVAVLKQHKLHRLTGEEILNFLADIDNRNKETIPSICKYYIREKGCYKGDNTDYETICHSLHLCAYILKGKCLNRECDLSHSIHDKQPLSLLQKYGLDPVELGDEKVLLLLGEKCIEIEKGKKVVSGKQSQLTKSSSSSRSTSLAKDNKESRGDSRKSAGEGLTIVTHSGTRLSSKYFVQNFKVPAVCKFYQNILGCRKKDWGAAGKCFFLHICQHYVVGDCSYGDKCKRSHDLFSGQAAEILEKYNFDLDNLTALEILKRLNSNSGAPVELPTAGKSLNMDNENVEMTIDSVGEPDEIHMSNFEISKRINESETSEGGREKDDSSPEVEKKPKETNRPKSTGSKGVGMPKPTSFASGNVEDVIKHIMEHNKVVKK